ncbi:MAG: polysaccharide biosynthesis/export family protein [Planctomycetota bacterium]|nr:polysaccharide biosynthesis/export family protein [Planctomycetota bacterium]
MSTDGLNTTAQTTRRSRRVRTGLSAGLLLAVAGLTGCETDSFMDPSVVGRWEWTPTRVPVLERLSAIEDGTGEFAEVSDVTPEDLMPEALEYRVGPGDVLEVEILDLVAAREAATYRREVDQRGQIDIPQLGFVYISGTTLEGARQAIAKAASRLINDPLVSITVLSARQRTFTITGAVEKPGPAPIPTSEYRLLEALTAGGRFNDNIREIFVIRQVPVSESASDPTRLPRPDAGTSVQTPAQLPTQAPAPNPSQPPAPNPGSTTPPADSGKPLIDLIDELSKPASGTPAPATQPATPTRPNMNIVGAPNALAAQPPSPAQASGDQAPRAPMIDLIENSRRLGGTIDTTDVSWVFLNGKWVQVRPTARRGEADRPGYELVTQRVIRIPLQRLMAGDARFNIVVRSGDVVRVPTTSGVVYISGQVQRPGSYDIPPVGRLKITSAITSAGGLSQIAIPDKVDLTRAIADGMQATVRVDLRAIYEGTQPNIYLRPDDEINVGTNFWATPLAVIRNGFRASYGFGFIVDRNLGDDIFGISKVQRESINASRRTTNNPFFGF